MHPEQDPQSIAAAIEADPVVNPLLRTLTGIQALTPAGRASTFLPSSSI